MAIPPSRHWVPPRTGHVMAPHAPVAQLTSHEHAFPQLIESHAVTAVQSTVQATFEPQVRPSQAPDALQVMLHMGALHCRLLHAFGALQVNVHDRALDGHMLPSHALAEVQAIVHA